MSALVLIGGAHSTGMLRAAGYCLHRLRPCILDADAPAFRSSAWERQDPVQSRGCTFQRGCKGNATAPKGRLCLAGFATRIQRSKMEVYVGMNACMHARLLHSCSCIGWHDEAPMLHEQCL